jgi:localization factor PodJL
VSETAISELPAPSKPPVSSSSFIAAARRAAQAAAAAQAAPERGRTTTKSTGGDSARKEPSSIASRIRAVLVAGSGVVIVLGTFKMAMSLLEGRPAQEAPVAERSSEPPAQAQGPAERNGTSATPQQLTPQMTSPPPILRQSFNNATASTPKPTSSVAIPQTAASDITGTIPTAQAQERKLSSIKIPPGENLPEAIGGPLLRAAALKGDPTAAYEVAVRFAEGRGAAANFEEAAKWYDRADKAGVIPATFRLGTFYEKGLGVKKDVDVARRYYVQAAERGNAKAMHNLAVLDADGGGKGPDYRSAAQWFRKAAEHGVADSQFNLGILYARGIGVEQDFAESFKWFSLAAAQGDADAARKRDDVVQRMDAKSLAAAKLAIETFVAKPQPDGAVNVATPPGGWDQTGTPAMKPAARTAAPKRQTTARL